MTALAEIVRAYQAIKRAEEEAVLATLVKVTGSAQQKIGHRMIIQDAGPTVGSSGNSELDAIVVRRALRVLDSRTPMSITVELGSPATEGLPRVPTSYGVVCVLLELLPLSVGSRHVQFIEDCLQSQAPGVVASIFRVDGEVIANVGTHVFLHGDGRIEEDARNPVLTAAITEDCVHVLRSEQSIVREYRITEGTAEALIEFINVSQ